jgi:hypothetical protein
MAMRFGWPFQLHAGDLAIYAVGTLFFVAAAIAWTLLREGPLVTVRPTAQEVRAGLLAVGLVLVVSVLELTLESVLRPWLSGPAGVVLSIAILAAMIAGPLVRWLRRGGEGEMESGRQGND